MSLLWWLWRWRQQTKTIDGQSHCNAVSQLLTNDVRVCADFEKFSAHAFSGDIPQAHPCRRKQSVSSVSDSEDRVASDSNAETEVDSENDQEMIELAWTQLSKFQQALRVEVHFYFISFSDISS